MPSISALAGERSIWSRQWIHSQGYVLKPGGWRGGKQYISKKEEECGQTAVNIHARWICRSGRLNSSKELEGLNKPSRQTASGG